LNSDFSVESIKVLTVELFNQFSFEIHCEKKNCLCLQVMKFFILLLLGAFVSLSMISLSDADSKTPKFWTKFTKVQASSSGKTCQKPLCRLKAVSRYNSVLNCNCNFNRTVSKIYVSFMIRIYISIKNGTINP
jgi:hypothetical protein